MTKYSKHYAQWYEQLKKDFIDEYFHGDMELWKKRNQPFIAFRHLFFRYIQEYTGYSIAEIARLDGLHPKTIANSLTTKSVDIHPVLRQTIKEFIVGRIAKDPLTRIRLTIQSESGSQEQVAKKYGVHVTVIDKIMNNRPIPPTTMNFLYRQCYTQHINK